MVPPRTSELPQAFPNLRDLPRAREQVSVHPIFGIVSEQPDPGGARSVMMDVRRSGADAVSGNERGTGVLAMKPSWLAGATCFSR